MSISSRVFSTMFFFSLLAGCAPGNDYQDLQGFVAEVNARPKGEIKPLPEFKLYESFKYSAAGLRAPFSLPVEVKLIKYQQEKGKTDIKPDLERAKEYLEGISIDSLKMVGTIAMIDGVLWALVDDSQGNVYRVKPGNYMGRNYGKVIDVNQGQIDIIEIVPDGHGGWLERPRSISLRDET